MDAVAPPPALSEGELTRFGVALADEGAHAFDPAVEWWNESWFWDWFDAAGERAGHCRIAFHPNQARAWLWLFVLETGEWIAIEEPRLPLADLDRTRLAYDRYGLRFGWDVRAPLSGGRLRVEGFGRVVSGPRTGFVLPVGVELDVRADGPPHSAGRARAPGHEAQPAYPASRFEQPISLRGRVRVGDAWRPFEGRGERDHSWGPRHWNLEWSFVVLSREGLRLQCAEALLPGDLRFTVGYLQRHAMTNVTEARFELTLAPDDVLRPASGRIALRAEDGDAFAARLEPRTGVEIDITHCFAPPRRSLYRRALVRATPEDGSPPLLGWLELNRFLGGGA